MLKYNWQKLFVAIVAIALVFQLVPWANIFADANGNNQETVSTKENKEKIDTTVQNNQLLKSGTNWTFSNKVTDVNGNTKAEYQPGDTIKLAVSIAIPSYSESVLNDTYTFWIQKSFFQGDKATFVNPVIDGMTPKQYIFTEDSIKNPTGSKIIDGIEYVGYTLQFNKNPEVLEKYANEPLTNAKFDMFFTLSSTISQKDVYTPIIIEDNSDIKISEIEIPVTPITPDDKDGVMRTVKKLESAWRIDSNTGNYIKIADNPENYVPQNGDLVYFNIYTNNYSGKTAVVSKMTDELPSGYAILEEDSTEWQALIKASGSQLQRGWKLSDDQTNLAPGAKRYDFPYDPAKEFAPNGGENRGLAAKVVDVTKDLTNIAKVPSAGGEGSTGSVTPSGEDIYDMALKTKITETYDKNNKFVGKVASDVTPVSISEGATVSINYTAVNQGNYTKNNVIYAYIPAGFELNNETDTFKTANQKWKYEKTVSKDKGNAVWSDIKVYSYTLPSGIESGGNKSALLYAKAQGMPDDGSYESTDFYIAGEIGSFSNFNGDTTLDGSITDVDSTPDMNPGNDLLSNVDGTVKPIDNFEKEKAHVINQNAKSTTVLQDEDDFDYDYVSFIEPPVVIPTNGKILEKKRLSAAKAQETARNLLGVDIVGKELKDYVPLADDGVITSPKTYMVYEMDINPDGIKDTLNSTITDTLPKGLKMLEYDINSLNSSNKHIYGFTMNKYEGTPKYTNADGDDVIVYEDGLYSSKQVCIANSTLNDIGVRYFGNNAEKMGVTGSVTNDARTLTLNFGQPSTDPFYNETKAAYKVYMIVIIDPNEIDYSSIMQNKATYTYNEKEIVSYENSEMSWAAGGGTAYAKKYVLDDKTNNYLGGSQYSIATPDANGNLSVDYKVRVRSAYEFDKAAININDKIPASNFKSISNVSINGFEATANTGFLQNGELESPKALDISDYALDASVNGDELTITNPIDIPQMQLYNVLFKVNYKDVKFGTKLVNRAAGSEVNTVVPLKLNILKQDDISKAALTGYEFKTYYTDENGKADLTKPVKDINGNEITITDTTGAASFIPDGYKTSAANQEWQIALVETKTPTGYESNENKEFPLTVKSDEAGNLSISTINEPNYKINNDVNGSTTAVIDNRADVKMIDVNGEKTWTGDKESDRPDSIEVQLLQDGVAYGSSVTVTKADDWKYEFKNVPETNANGDKYTYTVLENTVTNYTSAVTGLDINNTLIKPDIKMINLDGQKTWKNDTENDRPASIEIQLQQNGQDYGFPVTVTKANNWKYEFKNLPETTNDGVAYTYTVVEKAVSGYETKVDGMNIINTKIDTPKTSVSGEKTWENDTVKDRPNYIEVQLLQNGQAYGDLVKVTKENDWKYSFKDLPKADATNKDYRYSVAEIAVPGYKTTTDGMNLTNTKVTDDKNVTTASGTKTWVGDNAKTRPNSIEVQLLQDGKAYGTPIKVTKEMKWKYSFTNLPEKDATGKKYNYTVSEKQVAGYSAKVKGMDLTNTKTTTITPKNTDSTNKIIKPSKTKKLPGTGDANGMLLFVSGVALLFLGLYLKRKSVK